MNLTKVSIVFLSGLALMSVSGLGCGSGGETLGPDPGSGPDPQGPPSAPPPTSDPVPVEFDIEWRGQVVEWGAPAPLAVDPASIPTGGDVVWRSLSDAYLQQPVVLGRGATITTAALKPGTTTVEAELVVGGQVTDRDVVEVEVVYRESWGMALLGFVPYPERTIGDIWVSGTHALLARRRDEGVSIIDLDMFEEVGRYTEEGLFSQDVKSSAGIAYVAHEGTLSDTSVIILDINDPTNPAVLGRVAREESGNVHNLWIEGETLYLATQNPTNRILSYDVSDPRDPVFVAGLSSTSGVPHDVHARGNQVYGSYLPLRAGQIGEVVIATGPDLEPLSFTTYPGAFTHSSWLTEDGRYLYVADEIVNAPIRIFDVSNPAAPTFVATYQPRMGTIPHNLQIRDGRIAFLAHYKHGVEVLDVSDPLETKLIGFYDTFAGEQADISRVPAGYLAGAHEQSRFQGAWGVHWTADGRVVVSDMNQGVFVLRFEGEP